VEPRGLEPLTPCLQSGGAGFVERRSCLASREGAHPEPLNRAFVAASEIAQAAFAKAMWLNACGKLPSSSPVCASTLRPAAQDRSRRQRHAQILRVLDRPDPPARSVCQPERTEHDGALVAGEAVDCVFSAVPVDQPRSSMSRSSIASVVASVRGSVAGRNPTIAIIRLEASNAVEPTYWVNAPAASLHPSRTTVSQISSRSANSPVA
jgi:hypothetical protein